MKKGTIAIIFGWLLVAMQIMALLGSNLDSGFDQMGVIGLIGYFLPGILGIMLLCKGYKKRSCWLEEQSDTKPDTVDVIMKKIRTGLTGDPTKDRAFLNNQIQSYRNHPLADEIIGSCAKLLANTLSDDELNQWGQAMKADDERMHSYGALVLMVTYLLAMQKLPVRVRYVPPEKRYLRLEVRTSDLQSDSAGSNPAGITTSCFDLAVKMLDCLSGYTGSSPVGRAT